MLYHPEELYVWDTWYYVHEEQVHCIHLQLPRPGSTLPERETGALGHAVTEDLIHWQTKDSALYPGRRGSIDSDALWTGCVQTYQGRQYLYYTARKREENGWINRIALAISEDGRHFERWPKNPVITPDERWYCNESAPMRLRGHGYPLVDCRDMCVVEDPEGNGFWGYYAARRHASTLAESSVIALVHSRDLIHWEHLPPCFCPNRFGCIEVPEVFCLEGRWYMLCLTGNRYGQRGGLSDPLLREGTVYASADRPCGPFYMDPADNVLFGSQNMQGYAGKTVFWQGERILFFTQSESRDGSSFGCISLPHRLRVTPDGHLRCLWYEPLQYGYEQIRSVSYLPTEDGCWGSQGVWRERESAFGCEYDWALRPSSARVRDGMICVTVEMGDADSAGVAFRLKDSVMAGGLCVLLDSEKGQVELTTIRGFGMIESRTWAIVPDGRYRLRVVLIGNVIYVYVDDVLAIQCYEPEAGEGRVSLFVERGKARFLDFAVYESRE